MPDPFEDLLRELGASANGTSDDIRVDGARRRRTGAPEIVLGSGKTDGQIATAVRRLLTTESRIVISRCSADRLEKMRGDLAPFYLDISLIGDVGVVTRDDAPRPHLGGRIGCLSAGSSDIAVATEAVVVAREMGCAVETAWDVGVAGLHRLVEPLRRIVAWGPDAMIVAAGMDGVLPTVVAGLVDIPVIGLPVGNGYGHGGGGEAALSTMLQSCAPGVVVVNINNGVGAGIAAGKIANRAAIARRVAL